MDNALKLAINRNIIEEAGEGGVYKARFGYGSDLGFWDSNPQFSSDTLYGSTEECGVYGSMRYAHDIIASAFDSRRDAVAGLSYNVVPRSRNPTMRQKIVADAVKYILENRVDGTLSTTIAEIYDSVNTYGHGLYQIHIPEEGERKNLLHLIQVPSQQISWWSYDPQNRDRIESVDVSSGDSLIRIQASSLAWFGRKVVPGNFWGMSELRRILAPFVAYEADIKNYLAVRRLQQGVLYFQENDTGSTTDSWIIAQNFIRQYENGRNSPLIIPSGMSINYLSLDSGGAAGQRDMFDLFDQRIRAAVDGSLSNLGINGVGSLALGKEVSSVDREKFVAHVDSFIDIVNNPKSEGTDLLYKLTVIVGGDPNCDIPMVIVENNTTVKIVDQTDTIIKLLDKGIIRDDQIPLETRRQIMIEVGISTEILDRKVEAKVEEIVPALIQVGSLQVAAQMLQLLRSKDPSVPPLAPDVVRELVIGAGFTPEAADRMIKAQMEMVIV